ncbi:hypothetical protein PIB30_014426, partial [Stylosanthes scabra]|nr:hypothetical protein [Stylosanthes scabra]
VVWTPYEDPFMRAVVPGDVVASHEWWGIVCLLLCFSIIEWHQVDRVVMQLGAVQHIPLRPLNIDIMHRHDGRWGKGEWYPTFLQGWYDMWRDRARSRLILEMPVGGVRPSRQYLLWYYQWANLTLRGFRDLVVPAAPFIPGDVVDGIPKAPDMVQPEDGELPEVHSRVARRRRAPARRGRGRGQGAADGNPVRVDDPMQGVHADAGPEFDFGLTDADFLTLGLPGPQHATADTEAGPSQPQAPFMQLQIEVPSSLFPDEHPQSQVHHSPAYTPDVDQIPESYTQWCSELFGKTSYQPVPDHSSWGTPIQQSETFAHMTHETPPSAYEPRRQEVSGSDESGNTQDLRGDIVGRLDRARRETRPPPCGTGGCLDGRVVRRGRGRGGR